MARPRKPIDPKDIDPTILSTARKNAMAKQARLIAEAELGISDEGAPVIKGPAPIPDEPMVTLTLDMYEGASELRIDGIIYRHGQTITVGERQARSILEMIARGWRHQEEIDGKAHNFYKPRQPVLSGKTA